MRSKADETFVIVKTQQIHHDCFVLNVFFYCHNILKNVFGNVSRLRVPYKITSRAMIGT